jgi:hypothetical protein
VTDLRDLADSDGKETSMTTTTETLDNVSTIEDASNARWLAAKLILARARAKETPSAEALDRIRARVFGPEAVRKKERRIAA